MAKKWNVWDKGRWSLERTVRFDFMTRYILEHLLDWTDVRGRTIVELGAGTGRLSYRALQAGAAHATLVDSSSRAMLLAQRLFSDVDEGSYALKAEDILTHSTTASYDIALSSGTIEHFSGDNRRRIIHKHIEMASRECLIIHPGATLYALFFNNFPLSIWLYGYQKSFTKEEITTLAYEHPAVKSVDHKVFYPFYTVPLLHNSESVNRWIDSHAGGRWFGGLVLTRMTIKHDRGPAVSR